LISLNLPLGYAELTSNYQLQRILSSFFMYSESGTVSDSFISFIEMCLKMFRVIGKRRTMFTFFPSLLANRLHLKVQRLVREFVCARISIHEEAAAIISNSFCVCFQNHVANTVTVSSEICFNVNLDINTSHISPIAIPRSYL